MSRNQHVRNKDRDIVRQRKKAQVDLKRRIELFATEAMQAKRSSVEEIFNTYENSWRGYAEHRNERKESDPKTRIVIDLDPGAFRAFVKWIFFPSLKKLGYSKSERRRIRKHLKVLRPSRFFRIVYWLKFLLPWRRLKR